MPGAAFGGPIRPGDRAHKRATSREVGAVSRTMPPGRARAQIHFAAPLEALRKLGVRGTVFADTGSLAQVSGRASPHEGLDEFWNNWRLAMGVGARIPFAATGYLEVNFVQTLKQCSDDRRSASLQIGLSCEPYAVTPPRFL